jgi:ElaB/YqjD/DUF883 family membrane-anchored ribosome-binding protein
MLKSELLEREAEARRIELAETFDELRARATPGHVLDQLVDYATESGGADFFRNLRDQTVANPLALGLVGAGLAWLMMSGRDGRRPYGYYEGAYGSSPARGRMRSYFASTRERAGTVMTGARDRVSDAAHSASHLAADAAGSIASTARTARDAALDTASQWRDAAGSAASSLRDATSSTYDHSRSRVGDTTAATAAATAAAVGNAASAVYGGVAQSAGWTASGARALASGTAATTRDVADYVRDQPLVMMGLGVALGAAMGAAFPSTETERQLMGEASDDLREQTRAFAAENYEKTRSVAQAVFGDVQNRAREGSQQDSAHTTSLVPLEEEITEKMTEPFRPERIGLRDGRG